MVYKIFLMIFFIGFNLAHSKIIYDKNDIIITEIELNEYIDLHKKSFNENLTKNIAVKKMILIEKTINYFMNNNPQYILLLDEEIKNQYGKNTLNKKIFKNHIRFQKIRNAFVSQYFQKDFSIDDLNYIFSTIDKLELPISKNKCLIIEKTFDLKKDIFFINNFFTNLKNNTNQFQTIIDDNPYDVCINKNLFKKIENIIINYIEKKTEDTFNNFVYGKLN